MSTSPLACTRHASPAAIPAGYNSPPRNPLQPSRTAHTSRDFNTRPKGGRKLTSASQVRKPFSASTYRDAPRPSQPKHPRILFRFDGTKYHPPAAEIDRVASRTGRCPAPPPFSAKCSGLAGGSNGGTSTRGRFRWSQSCCQGRSEPIRCRSSGAHDVRSAPPLPRGPVGRLRQSSESGAQAVQKAVQRPSAAIREQPQETTQALGFTRACADSCELSLIPARSSAERTGLESLAVTTCSQAIYRIAASRALLPALLSTHQSPP